MPVRVGIIGLCEAGNLGDDLIHIAAVRAVADAFPDAQIRHLSFGHHVPEETKLPGRSGRVALQRVSASRDWPLSSGAHQAFSDVDYVLFGGGGLLQDSHQKQGPYQWLRYIPDDRAISVLAVGLGVGPLSASWIDRLTRLGQPFDACYLRDAESISLANNLLGWQAMGCRDFIDDRFLSESGLLTVRSEEGPTKLGVAVRSWPGLSATALSAHVDAVARKISADEIVFYVLEALRGRGVDVDFATDVRSQLRRKATTVVYGGADLREFTRSMSACTHAISMKFHSSIVWDASGTQVFPITYAPKTSALFGLRYQGLQVFEEPMRVEVSAALGPRPVDLVQQWADGDLSTSQRRSMRSAERRALQTMSFGDDLAQTIRRRMTSGRPLGAREV